MQKFKIKSECLLKNETHLREKFGDTTESIWAKAANFISEPMEKFIELSTFCCISSYDSTGRTDISPRGDAPGFIKVANTNYLLIPDRPGNRRFDTIRNILETSQVSLLFMIPGIAITLRVNGKAQVSYDPGLSAQFEVDGTYPKMVIIVEVEEAYGHCAKAIIRGKVWKDDYKKSSKEAPTLTDLMSSHLSLEKEQVNKINEAVAQDLIDSMY